jgi:hypothetical protein
MNASNSAVPGSAAALEERFGRGVAARLSAGARRKSVPQFGSAPVTVANGRTAALGAGWWTRIASVLPLVALIAGLMAVSAVQDDRRASELAEVDSALLTDDLPPAAYTDPGFAQFLRTSDDANR